MGLITDNMVLKMYVPNVLAEAAGEPSFLDKLSEYLNAAECWAADMFTGDELFKSIASGDPDGLREVFLPVVVYEAVSNALPSLDLVLTPNGFGIVSNQNIAPASKERVERLAKSTVINRDIAICQLFTKLRNLSKWHGTEQCRWFSDVLLCDPADTVHLTKEKGIWDGWLSLRPAMRKIEERVSDKFLGHEYMDELREKGIGKQQPTAADRFVMDAVKRSVLMSLQDGGLHDSGLVYVVDTVRNDPESYPTWHNSLIAEVYSHKPFKNKKQSNGYFF